ncbi:MAG: helix-turn-helix transcriptional regulator [Lachnospiraceae bacterium]|nr:helix-turn-helix transcriptional regulator [Lachnospiraceae bacterium]
MNDSHLNELRLLGLTIAYDRKTRGITQVKLAEIFHSNRTHMSNIEASNSRTFISLNRLFDIAGALDIPATNLLDFQNNNF